LRLAPVQLGGMGFVHYNNTVEDQVAQVKIAKCHTPGFVSRPAVMGPNDTVAALLDQKISRGFTSACVTDTGARRHTCSGSR
jgi:IMP dehydrogenase